jgi:uncharacterized repeat protein (TIGR02543 family)
MKKPRNVLSNILSALFVTLVMAGCLNVFDPPADLDKDGGTGTVILTLEGVSQSARTLLPADPVFTSYDVKFSREGFAGSKSEIPAAELSASQFTLAAGDWNVEVTGYRILEETVHAAASGGASLDVEAGKVNSAHVELKPLEAGKGVFTYAISLPEGITGASLRMEAGEETILEKNLLSAASGTEEVDSGFYYMFLILEDGEGTYGEYHAAHIYPGLVTELASAENPYDLSALRFASAAPAADTVSAAKTTASQESVNFTLTGAYAVGSQWKLYSSAAGGQPLTGVSASFNAGNNALTLSRAGGVPGGDYWVSVAGPGKSESIRLKLTVIEGPAYVTFNPNGGNWSGSTVSITKTVSSPPAIVELPASPVRDGYTFGGWNTASNGGGTELSALTTVKTDMEVFAKWFSLSAVHITESGGWFNAAYVKWDELDGAESYNVYYQGGSVPSYTKIDDPLIRKYPGYFRADIPGLAAGSYQIKVCPVFSGGEGDNWSETAAISVASHDRSGYAFDGGKVPGGYKMDGTPKSNARIIYVTDQNKDTITLGVNVDGKGDVTQTGVQKIIDGHKKGNEKRPLIIRLIGQIHTPADSANSYAGDMMFETKNAADTYITLEGVGDDATADGWGVRMKNASNIEISNIGFMNTAADEGDDVGLQQKNYYIWVHNCDLFYGKAGGDKDQAKGDGAMDSKGSTYVTFSYNHFWDNGKTHLVGNKESGPDGGPGLLTLHHNWYDHSDSRHPRVRVHTVHVYNNYYDGVAKYGIGATYGASVFAEGNYFRGTKKPMLISMQGSDVWDSASQSNKTANGTFSGEDGGIIKAYGNYFEGSPSGFRFVAYGDSGYPNSTVDFDAYVVANRSDTAPDTVKTSQGNKTYNNFDTAAGFYSYQADTAEVAKNKVMQYAGRIGGGDFSWTFTPADDASSDVNTALQSALVSYKTSLVSVQGESGDNGGGDNGGTEGGGEGGDNGGGDNGGGGEGGGTEGGDGGGTGGTITCHFTGKANSNPAVFSITGSYANNKGSATINGVSYGDCLKIESSTDISFTTSQAMTLTLYFASGETGKKVKVDAVNHTTDSEAKISTTLAAGTHVITKGDSINLFYILLEE